jgi:hypothetical protein
MQLQCFAARGTVVKKWHLGKNRSAPCVLIKLNVYDVCNYAFRRNLG